MAMTLLRYQQLIFTINLLRGALALANIGEFVEACRRLESEMAGIPRNDTALRVRLVIRGPYKYTYPSSLFI